MGESKRIKSEIRKKMTILAERWAFETSEWEARTVSEVRALPVLTVAKAAPSQLLQSGMKPNECFENCDWYEKNDPTGSSKAVVGWLVDGSGNYVLHAVIFVKGRYQCITPVPMDTSETVQFSPDPAILQSRLEHLGGIRFEHTRSGQLVEVGIRSDPAQTIANIQVAKDRMAAGVHP